MADITTSTELDTLTHLGNQETQYATEPSISILETFPSPSSNFYTVEFVQAHNEFTSLCPKTFQPDSATIQIFYAPKEVCVESKSLKLYLFAYRNSKGFGEAITNKIADDLLEVLQPRWLVVIGKFSPRGGIAWNTKAVRYTDVKNVSGLPEYEQQLIVQYN